MINQCNYIRNNKNNKNKNKQKNVGFNFSTEKINQTRKKFERFRHCFNYTSDRINNNMTILSIFVFEKYYATDSFLGENYYFLLIDELT